MSGGEWQVLSKDMDIEDALALNNRNKVAFATWHLEIMRTLESLCRPDPKTLEIPWDKVKAAMLKAFGPVVLDEAYFNAFSVDGDSGRPREQELGRILSEADDQTRSIWHSRQIPAEVPSPCQNASKAHLDAEAHSRRHTCCITNKHRPSIGG